MNKVLRRMSLDRRIRIFYVLICVVPVSLFLIVEGISGQHQRKYSKQNFEQSYFEQISKQVRILLSRYEQKVVDTAENNDLQADVILYTQNEEYQNKTVSDRINRVLDNLCQEELFFDYVVLRIADAAVFTGGDMHSGQIHESLFAQRDEGDYWIADSNENIYYSRQFQMGIDEDAKANIIIKCNQNQLQKLCDAMKTGSIQNVMLASAQGTVLYDSRQQNKTGQQTPAEENWRYEELSNGWKLAMESNPEISGGGPGRGLLLALLLLLAAAVGIRLLRDSLVLPLKEIAAKLTQVGVDSQLHNSIVIRGEIYDEKLRDEHALLDQELNLMLLRQKELTDTMYVHKIHEEKLQMKIKELELNAMQQQINPHFLLNILDTIYWMAEEKGYTQTEEMIATLGEYFRLSVSSADRYVRISEEIENAASYLRILSILHEASFQVEWDVAPELTGYYTVRLILQPLIENAYEHGLKKKKGGGIMKISCKKAPNGIQFSVEDNGSGMAEHELKELMEYLNDSSYEVKKSVGTKNVNMRIQMYFGAEYGLKFESKKDRGTAAVITIPYMEKGGEADV